MKNFVFGICVVIGVAGCELAEQIQGLPAGWTGLDWSSEPAGKINVRGRDYDITRRTGRDEDTGEVFVVEYTTKVDGRTVTCVGDIEKCPEAIEREIDNPRDDY